MALFGSIFGDPQQAGNIINAAANPASPTGVYQNYVQPNYAQALQSLQGLYPQAIAPQQTLYGAGLGGVSQLTNLLGLGGAGGNASALAQLQATPGYQFAQQQGQNSISAANAAGGQLASGKEAIDLSKFNQGLATQTYQNAVQNAMGLAGIGQGAANQMGTIYSQWAPQQAGLYTGLGQAGAGLGMTGAMGQANAALAGDRFWQELIGAIPGVAKLGVAGGGTLGGNAISRMFG
jgi:hypothetical protein